MDLLTRITGTVAPIVAFGGILLASVLEPSFTWRENALSHLGVTDIGFVFNGALVLGGLLGMVYAAGLGRRARSAAGRAVALPFALAMVSLLGVGLFPTGHPWHLPAAAGFYGLFTVCFLLDGVWRRAESAGRATLALVLVHVLIWVTWLQGWWPGDGLALPEFVGALLVLAWVWVVGPAPVVSGREDARLHSVSH